MQATAIGELRGHRLIALIRQRIEKIPFQERDYRN